MMPFSLSALGFVFITCYQNIVFFAPYDLSPDAGLILTEGNVDLYWAVMALWWVTCALDTLLFFVRVRAIFSRSGLAKIMFSVLWILVGVAPGPFLYGSEYPGNCPTNSRFKSCPGFEWFEISMLLAIACYNIIILVCVSRELSRTLEGKLSLRTLLTGKGLYNLSKALHRSGQLYCGYVTPIPKYLWNLHALTTQLRCLF